MNLITKYLNKLVIAIFLTILVIPFMIVALGIKITSQGPVFHWSKRIGKNNEIFFMPKFRTLKIETPDVATHLLKDHEKYGFKFGSFLRKTSMDELPQLWSVLIGDMNIVGPRPALHNQKDLIELRTNHNIHLIKPGITGWAQINGRDDISIKQKVKLDQIYYQKRSLFFDIYIICLTIISVIRKEDINH